jgi:hypothetical protein
MKEFEELLSETLDGTLRQVFGEPASELIYRLMESHVFLRREEIGTKSEGFFAYLNRLLGPENTQILQSVSLRCLCHQMRREYEEIEEYFSFLDGLYEVKFRLLVSVLEQEPSLSN